MDILKINDPEAWQKELDLFGFKRISQSCTTNW